MHKDETRIGKKPLDKTYEYSREKSTNSGYEIADDFSENSSVKSTSSSSELTCEDKGKSDFGDETDLYMSDNECDTGCGGMVIITSESSAESRDAPVESKAPKVERIVDKENKGDGTVLTFKCDYCGDTFKTAISLRRHRNQHIQKNSYFCDICEQTFNSNTKLRQHLEMCKAKQSSHVNVGRKRVENVSSTKKKSFACLECDAVFSYGSNLSRHRKLKHAKTSGEVERYECQFCPKTFPHQQALHRHKKYIHGKGRNRPMGKKTTVTNW